MRLQTAEEIEKMALDLGLPKLAELEKRASKAKKSLKQRLKDLPTGAKLGAAVGAGSLVIFGLPALLPVGIAAAGMTGYYTLWPRKWSRCMTPERIKIYKQAIEELKDPEKLKVLADEFKKAGCVKEADHLRKRAALRNRTPEEKKADRARYKKAMESSSIKEIEAAVSYFDGIGADGCAQNLRTRIAALKEVAA